MIKKIISILLILTICGCTDRISLNNLGYSDEDIKIITKYRYGDVKLLYASRNEKLLNILKDSRCKEENIKGYVEYFNDFDIDTLFALVNGNHIKKDSIKYYKKLVKCKYFIVENAEIYLKYISDFDDLNHLISYVNVGAYKKPYIEYTESKKDDELTIIANKWNYLDRFEPKDLVDIESKYGLAKYDQKIKKEPYEAFKEMYEAAKKDHINIYITSAYRDYDYQVNLYNQYLKIDSKEKVDTYSSRPGFSDHQTGLACDILSAKYDFDTFDESKAYEWLKENADKYGFILRYPEEKEDITGYIYESWHYRYVGKSVAKYIKENNLTYDEYYAYFIERGLTHESA